MEETVPSSAEHKKSFRFKKHWILIIVIVLVLGMVALYYYNQYEQEKNLLQNPGTSANVQVQQLVDQVGKLMVLPQEQPTVATVSDITKLQDQPFFVHAQNGDKVLLFSKANIAILYRPSINKIIQVGTLNVISNNTVSVTPPVTTPTSPVVVKTSPTIIVSPTPTP